MEDRRLGERSGARREVRVLAIKVVLGIHTPTILPHEKNRMLAQYLQAITGRLEMDLVKWRIKASFGAVDLKLRRGGENGVQIRFMKPSQETLRLVSPLRTQLHPRNRAEQQLVSTLESRRARHMLYRGVNLFELFAKHQPGVAGCGWLQPGRNFLLT